MKCNVCGREDAKVRDSEISTARITFRAHVDCGGHSQYRSLSVQEVLQICGKSNQQKVSQTNKKQEKAN